MFKRKDNRHLSLLDLSCVIVPKTDFGQFNETFFKALTADFVRIFLRAKKYQKFISLHDKHYLLSEQE